MASSPRCPTVPATSGEPGKRGRAPGRPRQGARQQWRGLVDISHVTADPGRAGLAPTGAILVRPDGHIGFLAPASSAGLGALDSHLDSYLIPS
jgi:6-methylpretetramide 4-monooxygenase / 4-hydroxy-6-methylpretetramide 12a-monooxygenase